MHNKSNKFEYFASLNTTPYSSRKNYNFSPSYIDLCRMTEEELKNVEEFVIENEHGKIQFTEPVDLRKVNLDKVIKIENKYLEIYENEDENKPNVGVGLNQPAIITFYNFRNKNNQSKEQFLMKLKKYARQMNAEFVGYDEEKGEVSIATEHF